MNNITEEERWLPIVGYEGRYEVSSIGQVKSIVGRKERIMRLYNDPLGYASVGLYRNKKHQTKSVHRLVIRAFRGVSELHTDHVNGNPTDNRLENLRYCTRSQNARNSRSTKGSSSKYKGVCWDKKNKKWQVHIYKNGICTNLGRFFCEKEAALAYDAAARECYGEFSKPNFV